LGRDLSQARSIAGAMGVLERLTDTAHRCLAVGYYLKRVRKAIIPSPQLEQGSYQTAPQPIKIGPGQPRKPNFSDRTLSVALQLLLMPTYSRIKGKG